MVIKSNTKSKELERIVKRIDELNDKGKFAVMSLSELNNLNAKSNPKDFCDCIVNTVLDYSENLREYNLEVEQHKAGSIDTTLNMIMTGRAEGKTDKQIVKDLYFPLEKK